ncbi:hypothetical protein EI94DRAFT_435797 [Lactarius quietus]|nr:hypothetical protein EI94DRAFT_435797 [Lactarius quietus]
MGNEECEGYYRLAPQYPLPCTLQDLLASYFFLIELPLDFVHCPSHPAISSLAATLPGAGSRSVVRDSGIPPPRGGVLISLCCDLPTPLFHEYLPQYRYRYDTPRCQLSACWRTTSSQ